MSRSNLSKENRWHGPSRERGSDQKSFSSDPVIEALFKCCDGCFSSTGLFHLSKGSVNHTAVTHVQNSLEIRAFGLSIEYDINKSLKNNCHQHSRWFELLIRCLKGTYKSRQLDESSFQYLLHIQRKLTRDQAFFFGERTLDRKLSENMILDSLLEQLSINRNVYSLNCI